MAVAAIVLNRTLMRAPDRFLRRCTAAARTAGMRAELLEATTGDGCELVVRQAVAAGVRLVLAAGGDGTVRACAQALAGTPIPLVIVPLGTANLTARALGVPRRPSQAIEAGFGGVDRRIDIARADDLNGLQPMMFGAMAGIGLDAAVVGATPPLGKRRLGWLAYAAAGAAHLSAPAADFTIVADGAAPLTRKARCVVVGNAGLLPGGFVLLPGARLDDGVLDVGILAPAGAMGWARLAGLVLTRSRHPDRQLERLQARRVEIRTGTDLPRQADGEIIDPGRTLTVTVLPGALTVRLPA